MRYTIEQQLEQARERSRKRRARKPVRVDRARPTQELIDLLWLRQKGLCACCDTPLGSAATVDHIMPLCKGGNNRVSNLQLLHFKCNCDKGVMLMADFMRVKRPHIKR